ncbi:MAG: hypothetical protein AAF591_21830, partial [Verrucomicrobiota bacterium]
LSRYAEMFKDPAMGGFMRKQLEAQFKVLYDDLLDSEELSQEERDQLEELLIGKQMVAASMGMKAMNSSLTKQEREEITASMKEKIKEYDAAVREVYGDELADKLRLYEKSTGERQELNAYKKALASENLELPFETEEKLMAVMFEERNAFSFSNGLSSTNPRSFNNMDQGKLDTFKDEYVQLQEKINARVAEILDEEQMEVFRNNQGKYLTGVEGMMRMSLRGSGSK